MRFPPRRSLILATVAALALALWAARLKWLSDGYRRLAWLHTTMANEAMMEAAGIQSEGGMAAEAAPAREVEAYHLRLMQAYDRLVRRPWESPPPDPLAAQGWGAVIPPPPNPRYWQTGSP